MVTRWKVGPTGKILKRFNSIVISDACCCGYSCCPTAPEQLRATLTIYDAGDCTAVDEFNGLPLNGYEFDMDAAPGETNVWSPINSFSSANCFISLGLACGDQSFNDYHLTYDALINDFSPESGVVERATFVRCDPFRVEFDMIYNINGPCCATEETPRHVVKIVIEERP